MDLYQDSRVCFKRIKVIEATTVQVGGSCCEFFRVKDTHREKALSNKTPALRKSTNMGVWTVGTLNQLFITGS